MELSLVGQLCLMEQYEANNNEASLALLASKLAGNTRTRYSRVLIDSANRITHCNLLSNKAIAIS